MLGPIATTRFCGFDPKPARSASTAAVAARALGGQRRTARDGDDLPTVQLLERRHAFAAHGLRDAMPILT